jgi:circadian clock protein KaiC
VGIYELTPPGALEDEQYTLYHPAEIELAEMVKGVLNATDQLQPKRVVLDSLSEMRLLARDPLRYRRQILGLKEYFAGRSCTVLMLDDRTSDEHGQQLQSIAHSVIQLEQMAFEYGRSRRRIRVLKVRGVPGVEGHHDFKIRTGGLVVYPQLVPATRSGQANALVRSGLAELDALAGGGLTPGTCTLLIGPAGVGKSSVAARYLSTGAADIPAAAFLFDERRSTFLERSNALGMSFSPHLADGRVTIEQIEPGELSPGEFAYRVCERVDAGGARVVLIDSLNGYLNGIPTQQTPLVRMYELIAYLNEREVVTILVAAQHGIMGMGMNAPIDVTYLADTVMLFRFFEAGGRVRKALSVVKKRTGAHETTIREFVIGPDGIRVGEPLSEFHGIMTGVPTYHGGTSTLLPPDDRRK